jgi:hypothetical protein
MMDETLTTEHPKEIEKADAKAPEVRFRLQQRHHDLALAEQAVHRASGRHMSVDDILKRNGFRNDVQEISTKNKMGARADLTMQALRLYVPTSIQTAMGVCLLDLKEGVLRIATGDRFEESELERVILALKRGKCTV